MGTVTYNSCGEARDGSHLYRAPERVRLSVVFIWTCHRSLSVWRQEATAFRYRLIMGIGPVSTGSAAVRISDSSRSNPASSAQPAKRLLIAGIAKGISVRNAISVTGGSSTSSNNTSNESRGVDRVNRLIQSIHDAALESRAGRPVSASHGASAPEQSTIDAALTELGNLLGMPLRLGGADRGVVSGLNEDQITAYEILGVPPNADITISGELRSGTPQSSGLFPGQSLNHTFVPRRRVSTSGINVSQVGNVDAGSLARGTIAAVSGTVNSTRMAAVLAYAGAPSSVVSGSVSFRLTGPDGSANLSITAGEALSDVAERINDLTHATGIAAEVQDDSLELRTIDSGAAAAIAIDNIERESVVSVSGVNGSQVSDFDVISIPDETEITLSGNVTQAASSAALTYLGGNGGVVVDSASFTLTGDSGGTTIDIEQGESLGDVADRVNQRTGMTGVVAATSGDDLLLFSVNVGSQANIEVELDEIAQYLDVSGVNPSQVTDFQVVSAEPDSVNTLSGSATRAAGTASLTYTGFIGLVASTATFTLTGSLGSANISVTALESLTTARNRINLQSATTGVTASVSGNNLFLTSTDVGSAAIVEVDVNSGTFNVSGGNGDGTANGIDALLTINGQPVVAAGNNVAFVDALGSYTFSLVQGYMGALNPITVTSSNGAFDVAGGNGDGTASGADAEATINGQALIASGNMLAVTTDGGQFMLEVFQGFTGAIDPITISSSLAEFTITGGNGDGTANGTDHHATINGQSLTSDDGSFIVSTSGGNLVVSFVDSFVGAIDPFSVTVDQTRAPRRMSAFPIVPGRAATAIMNGRTVQKEQGRFLFRQDGVEVALEFAPSFNGKFDPFRISAAASDIVSSGERLNEAEAKPIRELVAPLFSLASGGENANLTTHAGHAVRLAATALTELAAVGAGRHGGRARRSLGAGSALFDRTI